MKTAKITAVFLSLFTALFLMTAVYASGITTDHTHCLCGSTVHGDNSNHDDLESKEISFVPYDGTGDIICDEGGNAYIFLTQDVTLTGSIGNENTDLYICLNGFKLTSSDLKNPIVSGFKNLVICDCKGTGEIGNRGTDETPAKSAVSVGNSAKAYIYGGNFTKNISSDCGAAIYAQSGSELYILGGSFTGNTSYKNGGAVYANGAAFTMRGGIMSGNKVPNGSGGAVSVESGKMYTYGGEMNGNSAVNGGAVYINGNTAADISNITANNNTASNMAGAIFIETSGIVNINNIEAGENSAKNGGGICFKYVEEKGKYPYSHIRSSNIHDNTATGNGGGIYFNGNGASNINTSIRDSKICGNTATGNGGGIFVTSTAMINLYCGNTVSGNTATGNGGGVSLNSDSSFNIVTDSSAADKIAFIKDNSANRGGGIYTNADTFLVGGLCEIEGNTASDMGGGVYIVGNYYSLIFTKTTVTKNKAPVGAGICLNKKDIGYDLEIGGGTSIIGNTSSENGSESNLYLNNGRTFQLRTGINGSEKIGVSVSKTPTLEEPVDIERVFRDQYHDKGGDRSALIISDNSDYTVIYENSKHRLVPRSYTVTFDPQNGDEVNVARCLPGKTVSAPADDPIREGYIFGGWYCGEEKYDFSKTVDSDITLSAKWIDSRHTHCLCGDTYCYDESKHEILSKKDISFTAFDGTGDIICDGDGNAYLFLTQDVTLTGSIGNENADLYVCLNGFKLTSSDLENPIVSGFKNLVICDCKGTGEIGNRGGEKASAKSAVYAKGGSVYMYGANITENKVSGDGAAICLDGGKLYMYGGSISNNHATLSGGAVFMCGTSEVKIFGGSISQNNAGGNGGAIYATGSGCSIVMTDGEINGNSAIWGGGVYLHYAAKMTLSGNGRISENTVLAHGGGILLNEEGSVLTMTGGYISGNTADEYGAGIYATTKSSVNMSGGEISGNSAKLGGGVHLRQNSSFTISENADISGNSASSDGGGIYFDNSTVSFNMYGGRIGDNTANGNGGGICAQGSYTEMSISGGRIVRNTAFGNGAGIYHNVKKLSISNDTQIYANMKLSGTDEQGEEEILNNVYLANSGRVLSLSLSEKDVPPMIGISVSDKAQALTDVTSEDYSSFLRSDDTDYVVIYDQNSKVHKLAKSVCITLDPMNDGEYPTDYYVAEGAVFEKPEYEPMKYEYRFFGWYTENGERYDFSQTVNHPFTLYAKYIKATDTAIVLEKDRVTLYGAENVRNGILYLTGFDSDGRITSVKTVNVNSDGETTFESIGFDGDSCVTVRAFLWSENLAPLCESAEYTVNK